MARRPRNPLWLIVALAFLAIGSAWAIWITVALRNQPERVPLVR